MIGLLRLTPVKGKPINFNPTHITLFGETTPFLVKSINVDADVYEGTTTIVVGSMFYQVKESEDEIVKAITRLRKKQEFLLKEFRKEIDREDWQSDNETEDD